MSNEIEQSGLQYSTMMNILNGKATTSPITDAIIKNIKPHWPGTYLKAIEFQGNWPTTAVWGVCLVTNHRSFYNQESQSNFFFDTKEEMDNWILTIGYDSENFAVKLYAYEWDLGPQYRTLIQIS